MIELKSINFNERRTEMLEPRTNWFVNTCNISIPSEITDLPSLNREKDIIEIKLNRLKITFVNFGYTTALVSETNHFLSYVILERLTVEPRLTII